MAAFCRRCGVRLLPDAQFCEECGAAIPIAELAPGVPVPTAQPPLVTPVSNSQPMLSKPQTKASKSEGRKALQLAVGGFAGLIVLIMVIIMIHTGSWGRERQLPGPGGQTGGQPSTDSNAAQPARPQQPAMVGTKPVANPVQVKSQDDPIEALAGKWDVQCTDRGCLMFIDVLIGDPNHPANMKHPEYITIAVAINRSDRKPAYFAFDIPANADHSKGVSISFIGNANKGNLATDAAFHVDFSSCNQESCRASVPPVIVSSATGISNINLLKEFLTADYIMFWYTKNGQEYSTIKALFPFQRDYPHLMETALKRP
jgi:hypothetical protein